MFYEINDEGKITGEPYKISDLTAMYDTWVDTSLMFAISSYVNPDSIKVAKEDGEDEKYYTYASM